MMFRRIETKSFHCWIYGFGSSFEVEKFGFWIAFFGGSPDEQIWYVGPVIPVDKPVPEVIAERMGLVMSDSFVRRICDDDEKINCKLNIFQKKWAETNLTMSKNEFKNEEKTSRSELKMIKILSRMDLVKILASH